MGALLVVGTYQACRHWVRDEEERVQGFVKWIHVRDTQDLRGRAAARIVFVRTDVPFKTELIIEAEYLKKIFGATIEEVTL